MSSYFLQREGHRIFVLSTIKIRKGLQENKVLFFCIVRERLPLPFPLWNIQFVVPSVKEMLNFMLQGLSQYQTAKDQGPNVGGVTSDHCRILSVFFNPCSVVLAPARNKVPH